MKKEFVEILKKGISEYRELRKLSIQKIPQKEWDDKYDKFKTSPEYSITMTYVMNHRI